MELGQVLGALPPIVDPNVLHGAAARDDAAVYRIAPDRALVATVDFFTPIVDGPADFGAIAAANALSDVYAVGAKPLFALGITAFPRDKLGTGLLEKIVGGGAAKLAEAGVPVVGGHSVDDAEPKFGYAVIGEVHPDRAIGHEAAHTGDVLFLTKPLGTGLVTTAIKRGLCPPALEREAIAVMTTLNREASEAMVEAGATAATDVTGYGLIGHLANLKGGAGMPYRPGLPPPDAVVHVYETRCLPGDPGRDPYVLGTCHSDGYGVEAVVVWRISYSARGPIDGSGALSGRTTGTSVAYPVSEVRAFLATGVSR